MGPPAGAMRTVSSRGVLPAPRAGRSAIRRGACDRPGVAPAGELHQRRDAVADRRMGRHQGGQRIVRRVLEEQRAHLGRDLRHGGMAFDLAQRRDHRIGVGGQFHRPRIGQEFPVARQRHAQRGRQQPGERDHQHADDRRPAGIAGIAARPASRRAAAGARDAPRAGHHVEAERDDADEDRRDQPQPRIAVADMAEFMGQHRAPVHGRRAHPSARA